MVNHTIDKVFDIFETYVCAALFFAMCGTIIIQIVLRTTGLPLAWTEELARYLNVWVIYLAASKAVRLSKHMSVDILPILLRGKAAVIVSIFAQLVSLAFFLILCWFGAEVLGGMSARPQFSPATGTNMCIPYAAPFVGSIMMSVRSVQNLVGSFRTLMGKGETGEVAQ